MEHCLWCRWCSNYIFILDLIPCFIGIGKDNWKTRLETFKFWDLMWLILEIWWQSSFSIIEKRNPMLNHGGRVTHICVSKVTIIGSDNGLWPGRRQAIIWTNAGILLIGPLGTKLREILSEIYIFSLKKMHLKMSSGNRWRFCLSLNVLYKEHYIWRINVQPIEGLPAMSWNLLFPKKSPWQPNLVITNQIGSTLDRSFIFWMGYKMNHVNSLWPSDIWHQRSHSSLL